MWGPPSEVHPNMFIYNTKLGTTTRGYNYQVELSIENEQLREFNCTLISSEKQKPKSGCFVATSCYGDYEAKEVLVLRNYRDDVLLKTKIGKIAVSIYYFISPSLAKLLDKSSLAKSFIRKYFLNPIITRMQNKYIQ